ncbi:MAG: hypothetical protein GWP39_02430 [Planctomycetia bacterium]|nr:hypothetical protein [Planctomycetia bacterium]
MSSVDKTQAQSSLELVFNKETDPPTTLVLTVLIGRRNEHGKTAKGNAAFSDGVEHIAFTYSYQFDTSRSNSLDDIPLPVRKLLK